MPPIVKVNDGQSGYLSHSDLPLYFGLGSNESATKIEVRWPSGKMQTLDGAAKGVRTIVESRD